MHRKLSVRAQQHRRVRGHAESSDAYAFFDLLTSPPGIWSVTPPPVPLPGTLGLFGMGLVGLSNLRRKLSRAE